MIDAPGLPAKPRHPPEPVEWDSSDDELTDYDDDGAGDPRPRDERAPRAQWTEAYRKKRTRAWIKRSDEWDEWGHEYLRGADRDHYILLEYMENGSLAGLMKRRLERNDQDNPPPNRVLWAFWLCCKSLMQMYILFCFQNQHLCVVVRGVVGLEYPPNKFDPTRRRKRPVISEWDPERREKKRRRSRRLMGSDPTPVLQDNAGNMPLKREVKNLGIPVWTQAQFDTASNEFDRFGADLNEEVPTNPVAARHGESVVHFDLDPNNGKQQPISPCWIPADFKDQSAHRWLRT